VVADIFRTRVMTRQKKGAEAWGWGTAYGNKEPGSHGQGAQDGQGNQYGKQVQQGGQQ